MGSASQPIDEIDRRLLRLLQANGRARFADLARGVGLSQAGVRNRAQGLLGSGVLRIVGLVDPSVLGIKAMAAVGLSTRGPSPSLINRLTEMAEVTFLVATAGRYDAIAEVRCRSNEHLLRTLAEIRSLEGVHAAESGKYVHVSKEAHAAPDRQRETDLDDLDFSLLRQLEVNGRASYAELSHVVGLSQAATAVRVKRLVENRVVRIAALVDPIALGIGELCGFTITVERSARAVAANVAACPETEFVAVTAGRWDIIGTVGAASDEEVVDVLDRVRSVEGIRRFESYAHLALAKEQYPRLNEMSS